VLAQTTEEVNGKIEQFEVDREDFKTRRKTYLKVQTSLLATPL